jgi:vacuolar iron transporter family protein
MRDRSYVRHRNRPQHDRTNSAHRGWFVERRLRRQTRAAGDYVSVHSQADTEHADFELERAELKADDEGEHKGLTAIYVARGLDPLLAKQVAEQLMLHDALGAHARDELGISETLRARPFQAALASAASFAAGAAMPILVTAIAPAGYTAISDSVTKSVSVSK